LQGTDASIVVSDDKYKKTKPEKRKTLINPLEALKLA